MFCNQLSNCNSMPPTLLIFLVIIPHSIPCVITGMKFWAILISFIITTMTILYLSTQMSERKENPQFVLYIVAFRSLMIYETERHKLQLFLSNRDLQINLVENQRLEKETRTSEMRYMIYNLRSTIKDVSVCFYCSDYN